MSPPGRQERPEGNHQALSDVSFDGDNTATVHRPTDSDIRARRRWALALIRRCPKPPATYGTAAWLALPEGSAERIAAVVIAAESWAVDGDHLEERLRREVAEMRAVFQLDEKAATDAAYAVLRDDHRRSWRPATASFAPDPEILADVEAEFRAWVDGGDGDE